MGCGINMRSLPTLERDMFQHNQTLSSLEEISWAIGGRFEGSPIQLRSDLEIPSTYVYIRYVTCVAHDAAMLAKRDSASLYHYSTSFRL